MGCGQSINKVDSETPFTLKYDMRKGREAVVLGEGAFGIVYRAKVRSIDDQPPLPDVAVKCINTDKMEAKEHDALLTEVGILQKLNHPAIVKCYDFYEEVKK